MLSIYFFNYANEGQEKNSIANFWYNYDTLKKKRN